MFFLNMVDYPVFFPSLSTLTWDTFLTLRGTWGFYLRASKDSPSPWMWDLDWIGFVLDFGLGHVNNILV